MQGETKAKKINTGFTRGHPDFRPHTSYILKPNVINLEHTIDKIVSRFLKLTFAYVLLIKGLFICTCKEMFNNRDKCQLCAPVQIVIIHNSKFCNVS